MIVTDRVGTGRFEGLRTLLATLGSILASPYRFVQWLANWLSWWTARSGRRIALLIAISLLVLGVLGTRTSRLDLRYDHAHMERVANPETFFIPPPVALKVLSLGHQTFMADLLFLRANLYFVDHLFGDRIFNWLDTYVKTMVALDPNYERVYEWAVQSVKYGQMVSNKVIEKSNDYARMAIKRFPDDWRFYFDIGFNYFIEWHAKTPAEHQKMRKKALPYFSIAAALPGSQLDPNFVTSLYLEGDDVEMALCHAYMRYWEASPRERRSLRARITRYESQAAAHRLSEMEHAWKSSFPYMNEGLFELVGKLKTRAVPESWASVGVNLKSAGPLPAGGGDSP